MLKAGIIGAGTAGNWHANAVKKNPEMCALAAIANLDEKRLKFLQRKHPQVAMYADYREILNRIPSHKRIIIKVKTPLIITRSKVLRKSLKERSSRKKRTK